MMVPTARSERQQLNGGSHEATSCQATVGLLARRARVGRLSSSTRSRNRRQARLAQVADLLARDASLKPTMAMTRAMRSRPSRKYVMTPAPLTTSAARAVLRPVVGRVSRMITSFAMRDRAKRESPRLIYDCLLGYRHEIHIILR
jgi:hypothetical protein